jgi:transcriptional regulator with XRE-family HTH domain|tara:strand:+ start:279 stop:1022 length:744 start_codon:yes stop_codon:yes gene_type:complete
MLNETGAATGAIGVVKESMIYRYGAGRMVASPRPAFYDATMSDIDPKDLIRIAHEDGTDGKAQPLDLGARVRELRKAQDWTLEQAANQAGLARSTLSKIENGQMSPTYEALKKLAVGLQISVPQLFTPPSRDQVNGRMVTTLAGDGGEKITTTYEHNILANTLTAKKMLPYQTRVRARSMDDFDGWVRHDGEEFLYVLTGKIQLFTEFYEPVTLSRGDSAYYDASMGHNVISISADDATLLWVTSLV